MEKKSFFLNTLTWGVLLPCRCMCVCLLQCIIVYLVIYAEPLESLMARRDSYSLFVCWGGGGGIVRWWKKHTTKKETRCFLPDALARHWMNDSIEVLLFVIVDNTCIKHQTRKKISNHPASGHPLSIYSPPYAHTPHTHAILAPSHTHITETITLAFQKKKRKRKFLLIYICLIKYQGTCIVLDFADLRMVRHLFSLSYCW